PQGRIVSVSDHWLKSLGYQQQEVIGQPLTTFIAEEDKQKIDNIVSKLKNSEFYQEQPCQFVRKNGDRMDVLLSGIAKCKGENDTTSNSLGVIVDITERKQTIQKLSQATAAAEAASKAKSRFLANMSHELRSPLNAILGFSQVLRESDPSEAQKENIDVICSSGEHLLALINDVLDMSKIEAGHVTLTPSKFDLYCLLDELQHMLRSAASAKGLELRVERSPDLPQFVLSDRLKLKQILINLLSNAVKFTHTGSVTLTARKAITTPKTITFIVSDTGLGISKAEQTQLFDAFVQTTSGLAACEGTGLGLTISHRYVQLLGGELTVESAVGKGTTFTFSTSPLPIEDKPAMHQVSKGRIVGLAPGQPNYKILVADDILLNRKLLTHLLSTVGFEVRESSNGREAINQWHAWKPDLIWMDMHMPIMNGHDATRHIKILDAKGHTRLIAITASALEEEKTAALDSGCDDFVSKPIRAEQIYEKMALHLGVRYQYEAHPPTANLSRPSLPIPDASTLSPSAKSLTAAKRKAASLTQQKRKI
ncbi:MAG: ATP-binding protein, partial [Phormidesmis sp.]